MKKQYIIIGYLGVLLLSMVAVGLYMRNSNKEHINELETQLNMLREQEKKSAVDRRVSKQMEEIAHGQQIYSEERRKEAIRQSKIAQEMTLRSEAERKKAIEAQNIAEEAAQMAMEKSREATLQREEAYRQRKQAEHAKLVADTLSYITLGRTLGSQSYAIYQTGDTEMGNMLAYASYLYTKEYEGDLFIPAVFQALTLSAGTSRNYAIHNGSISSVDISTKDNHILTVSTYGEMLRHTIQNGKLQTKILINDRNYCFRDVFADNDGKDYAISHTGHLVIADGSHTRTIYLENIVRPFSLRHINNSQHLLIIGENAIALLDMTTDKIIGTRRTNFHATCTGRYNGKPMIFDNNGHMHLVSSLDDMTNEKVPASGQVTAFACNKEGDFTAYGMADGTIWLKDRNNKMHKLVGHLSQVTKMKFNGERLYTSSYDGNLLSWTTSDMQVKPITLFHSNSWLTDFTLSADRDYIWMGEYNGTLTEHLISLPKIAQRLRQNVKRNFTQEEWNYYVGKEIPYRKFKDVE